MNSSSQYEIDRQRRIDENKLFLQKLGLDKFRQPTPQKIPQKQRLHLPHLKGAPPSRSSSRLSGSSTNFEELDDEGEFRIPNNRGVGRKRRSGGVEVRVVGGRVYDSVNGSSCHQCRQKTMDQKVKCTNVIKEDGKITWACNLMMDERCLVGRYGESIKSALEIGEWVCPKCSGTCNCSFCMKKKGKRPTGQLFNYAKSLGFTSVKHLLDAKNLDKSLVVVERKLPVRSKNSSEKKRNHAKNWDDSDEDDSDEDDNIVEEEGKEEDNVEGLIEDDEEKEYLVEDEEKKNLVIEDKEDSEDEEKENLVKEDKEDSEDEEKENLGSKKTMRIIIPRRKRMKPL